MLIALILSNITLASQDYRGALTASLACTAGALVALAVPARRGPGSWRLAALIFALPAAFVTSDVIRRAPQTWPNVKPDTRPAFALDASKPFVIELGRGGGLGGLDIARFDSTGAAEFHRAAARQDAEVTTLRLSPVDVKGLIDLANRLHLTGMGRSYSGGFIDGTQWLLRIEQGQMEKAVIFDNWFPTEIRQFAAALDAALTRAGLSIATWRAVPRRQEADYQKALWDRIR
jgi:hypothetical protein